MSGAIELPAWAALVTSALLLAGAGITLVGAVGLVRLGTFYERVHAPTLGTTLGVGCIAAASMLLFTMLQTRPAVHEVLILVFVTVTTPVTLMILVKAALLRDRAENADPSGGEPPARARDLSPARQD
jgi:multicomponent K+:H+ antiporter subunit G